MNTRDVEVDEIMSNIPENVRYRWCMAEICACMGCVQVFNRQVIVEKTTNKSWHGDPEYIDEAVLKTSVKEYAQYKITKEEWLSWKSRNPQPEDVSPKVTILRNKSTFELNDKLKYELVDPVEIVRKK